MLLPGVFDVCIVPTYRAASFAGALVLALGGAMVFAAPPDAAGEAAFQRVFGQDLARLGPNAAAEAKGRLAERIFLEARGRVDDRAFVSRALEEVVRLAAASPAHQDLLYAALRTQKNSHLKPEEACLAAMMAAGPKALAVLDAPAAAQWLSDTWLPDAMSWAERLTDAGHYVRAAAVLNTIRDAAGAKRLPPPAGLDANLQALAAFQQTGGRGVYRVIILLAQGQAPSVALAALGDDPRTGRLHQALEMAARNEDRAALASALDGALADLRLPSLAQRLLIRSFARAGTETLGRIVEQTFFGVPVVAAGRVVFVIDFSGSMTQRLYYAKEELKRAVGALTGSQQFQVIFFDTAAHIMPPGSLVQATAANKAQADGFIDQMGSGGGTNPTDALQGAFALGADTVVLLTDGQFDPSVVSLVDGLNAGRRAKVHTIGFFATGSQDVLREIASRNGGTYKFVGDMTSPSP